MKDNLYIILKVNFETLGNNVIHKYTTLIRTETVR